MSPIFIGKLHEAWSCKNESELFSHANSRYGSPCDSTGIQSLVLTKTQKMRTL